MIKHIFNKLKSRWQTSFFGSVRKNTDALKWGIIGTGYMADTFSKAIIGNKSNILYAIASRTKDKALKFAKAHNAKIYYGNYEDLVKDEAVDIVYIATPVQCHYENIRMCLLANKHVLCEKPLTLEPEEAEELFNIASERNLFLMEGMWTLTLPTIEKAKDWIDSGLIGTIQFIRVDLNKRISFSHIQKHHGVLNDYGVYGIAFMQVFLVEETPIQCAIKRKKRNSFASDWCIIYKTDKYEGCLNIMSSLNAPSKAVVIGEKGSIEWTSPFNRTNKIIRYDNEGNIVDEYKTKYSYEGFEYQLNEVYSCIKTGKTESLKVSKSITINCIRTIKSLNDEAK